MAAGIVSLLMRPAFPTKQVAFGHRRFNDDNGGGTYKVTAFVEIKEPELHSTLDYQAPNARLPTGVRANFDDDDGVVLYFGNDDEDDEDEEDDDEEPPRGLSLEEINGLKQERFKSGGEEECLICLEEFSAGVNITLLPCSHTFHHNCIASWLQKQGSCPFCRFDITQQCSSPSLKVFVDLKHIVKFKAKREY